MITGTTLGGGSVGAGWEGAGTGTVSGGALMDGTHGLPAGAGQRPGTSAGDTRRIAELEREVRELRIANDVLRVVSGHRGRDGDPGPPARVHAPVSRQAHRATVEFRVLGPVEAVVAGRLAELGAPKQRSLLALLVSRVGQSVAVDVMLEELWAGSPPRSAMTSLQAYVANLRKVLEPDRPPRAPATVLRTSGQGYLLDGRVAEVDVHRFTEHATTGWWALNRGDPWLALSEFQAGLALWRGQAYPEMADALYVVPEIVRLEELRLSVVEGRCAALLAVGYHEMAVAELRVFVRAHPLREYGCELLSRALYRAGRQADALAVLRTNQRRLTEELGIDPRPVLRDLERDILNQDPALDRSPVPASGPGPGRAGAVTSPEATR